MTETKTHWKKLHNPDYLGAYYFNPGEDIIVTIKKVQNEIVTGTDGKAENCSVIYFAENIKPMILNVKNSKMITKLTGSPYIEDWPGYKIQLYITKEKVFGVVDDVVRVRPQLVANKKEALTPKSEKWAAAISSLAAGTTAIDKIKNYYELSQNDEKELLQAVAQKTAESGAE